MSYYKVKFLSGASGWYKALNGSKAAWLASKDGYVCSVRKLNLCEVAGVAALVVTAAVCGIKLYLMVG